MLRALAIAVLVASLAGPVRTQAQEVRTATLCLKLGERSCLSAVPPAARLDMAALPRIGGQRVLYYWADLRAPSATRAAILFLRQGASARPTLKDATGRLGHAFEAATPAIFAAWFGVNDPVQAKDITMIARDVGPAVHYRFWGYRVVGCAGQISARMFGADGQPLKGANDPLSVEITAAGASSTPSPSAEQPAPGE